MDDIRLEDVTYTYPATNKPAVKHLNLTIGKGEFVAVVGKNGSGKTTLCNIIRGFIPHFYEGKLKGNVYLKGKEIREHTIGDLTLDAGYVFQNPFSQNSGTKNTVFEEIGYGLENIGVERREIIRRVKDIIALLEIEHLQFKSPVELSGGQRQRVALASIIVMEPDILIIDEPTSQLDPKGTDDVFKIIKKMKDKGKTVILVEHKIDRIAEYADRVIYMNEGEILRDGPTKTVLTDQSLLPYNPMLPQFTFLGMRLVQEGININDIPVTLQEAVQVMSKLTIQERG